MALQRPDVAHILRLFLTEGVPQERMYEWALAQAVSKEYEQLTIGDPLIKEVIQAILEMNHADLEHVPTRDDLIYYLQCLEGTKDFEPAQQRRARVVQEQRPPSPRKATAPQGVDQKMQALYLIFAKVYVALFASVSLAVNIAGLVKPELFGIGESAEANWKESLPHLIYAVILLIPRKILIQNKLFYPTMIVLILGILFYWTIDVSIVTKFRLHILLVFLFAPFTVIPASLAVWLFWRKRQEFIKS